MGRSPLGYRPTPLNALDNWGANGALMKVKAVHPPMHPPCRFSHPSLVRVCRLADCLVGIFESGAGPSGTPATVVATGNWTEASAEMALISEPHRASVRFIFVGDSESSLGEHF